MSNTYLDSAPLTVREAVSRRMRLSGGPQLPLGAGRSTPVRRHALKYPDPETFPSSLRVVPARLYLGMSSTAQTQLQDRQVRGTAAENRGKAPAPGPQRSGFLWGVEDLNPPASWGRDQEEHSRRPLLAPWYLPRRRQGE